MNIASQVNSWFEVRNIALQVVLALIAVAGLLAISANPAVAMEANPYPVPPPDPVETDINVGVYIFPGWYRDIGTTDYPYRNHDEDSEWKRCISKYSKPRPLLGFYDDSLPEVNDWHIKWALEAGISFFLFDWYWNAGEKRLYRTLENGFLKARYNEMIKFAIHWCNHPVDWRKPLDFSAEALEEMIRYCVDNYFKKPNYLMIDGRPVFAIWDIQAILKANGGPEAFNTKVLPRLNKILHDAGLGDLYLILVNNNPLSVGNLGVGDAFTGYSYDWVTTDTPYAPPGSAPYREMVEGLPRVWRAAQKMGTPFIISTQSGWDNTPRAGLQNRWVRTGSTPELFEQTLQAAKKMVDPKLPYVIIEAWNEWGEGSFIEPSKEFGFGYLDAIRKTFAPQAPPNQWVQPTIAQIRSYSILSDEELAEATEREKYPEPPPVSFEPLTRLSIDPEKLPGSTLAEWAFNSDDARRGWSMGNLSAPVVENDHMVMTITNEDPQMMRSGKWGPLCEIQGVAIRLRYQSGHPGAQFFWATDVSGLSEQNSRRYLLEVDSEFHTYLIEFNPALKWEGNLKTIRFDFPDEKGAKVEIQWIKLLKRS